MSAQQLTCEGVLEMFRETDRLIKNQGAEFDRRMQEADRRMQERDAEYARRAKATNKKIGELTGSLGRIIERMVSGHNIIKGQVSPSGGTVKSDLFDI